jgi:anthranilate synthase component 1
MGLLFGRAPEKLTEEPMQAPFDIIADLDTPVSAYLKLEAFRPVFLLESVERGEHLARYSFIGLDEGCRVLLDGDGLQLGEERVARPSTGAGLLGHLREALARAPRLTPESDLPFVGGLVGAAGYDVVRYFERMKTPAAATMPVPELAYVAPRSVLVFDHLTRRMALLHEGSEGERQQLQKEIVRALRGGVPYRRSGNFVGPARASISRDDFIAAVGKAKQDIRAGDVYQLVLSVGFHGECTVDSFDVYRALRLLNPSPYMYYLDLPGVTVAGSSPEALVRLHGRRASLRPIAGTRPRGGDSDEDLELERQLRADPKELAEHVMLVDLARNDLGRVATAGSVIVDPYCSIERYSHVMHLVSGVQGELRHESDAFDLFAAAFPAGTLVGAPKVRAMELIDQYEPTGRGLYAGTAGYFGIGGDMDQAIAIRTLVFTEGAYTFQAGAGIVADSVAEAEYDEVLAKSRILRRALEMAQEGP